MNKNKVLILTQYFVPGCKAGGPIRSIYSLTQNLKEFINIYVLTSDRDFQDVKPYPNVETNKFINKDGVFVLYHPWENIMACIKKVLGEYKFKFIYINNFYSFQFSIYPTLLLRLSRSKIKIVIAPRGQFNPGALAIKEKRKKIYILIAKSIGLYKKTIWHATNKYEYNEIIRIFGKKAEVINASNLFVRYYPLKKELSTPRNDSVLKIVTVSRVHPIKNIDAIIKNLKSLKFEVIYDIYGPFDDSRYYDYCVDIAKTLPSNIRVAFKGPIQNEIIVEKLFEYHVFMLLSKGENFGHVVLEAFSAKLPVILSNKTPWNDLEERGVGYNVALGNESIVPQLLQRINSMKLEEYIKMRLCADAYLDNYIKNDKSVEIYKQLFT